MRLIVELDDATPAADLSRILDTLAGERPWVRSATVQEAGGPPVEYREGAQP